MSIYERLLNKDDKLAVIGLGYVGIPLAVALAKKADVIGFDLNAGKIALYQAGKDPTQEVGDAEIQNASIEFTADAKRLSEARFHIIAVPTPVNQDKTPDLQPVTSASKILGRNLKPGAVVVYESTVYPGVTEDICIPILEKESGLRCGEDFKVGYSPERINPGDKKHRLENIRKIVSGIDRESLEEISKVYELVIQAGVHRAPSIRVAEAAKVVENSQRDINIAFMNELAMVFDRMGIDTYDVLAAMNTKWNALGFTPGLVGGHCIGVDPYYFVYQAEKLGYHSQIILSGRKINDSMGTFIADAVIKQLVLADKMVRQANVILFGITFKENCPDCRNSKAADIIGRLQEYGITPKIVDPLADAAEVKKTYGIEIIADTAVKDADCIIFAVAHKQFCGYTLQKIESFFKTRSAGENVIIDVKHIFDKQLMQKAGFRYWGL